MKEYQLSKERKLTISDVLIDNFEEDKHPPAAYDHQARFHIKID